MTVSKNPRFKYVEDKTAPFGFQLADANGALHDPVELSLTRDVEIFFDKVGLAFWLQGQDMPWFCPIKPERAYEFAAIVGVKIQRLKYKRW